MTLDAAAPQPPFKILQADHTGITVADLEGAIGFWRDVLGFRLLYRARREAAFAAGVTGVPGATIEIAVLLAAGHKIELLQYLAPDGRTRLDPRPCDVGSVHVAFDVDHLDAVLARVVAAGWHVAGSPQVIAEGMRSGTRIAYVRDPDGTTIEFMQPPAI